MSAEEAQKKMAQEQAGSKSCLSLEDGAMVRLTWNQIAPKSGWTGHFWQEEVKDEAFSGSDFLPFVYRRVKKR